VRRATRHKLEAGLAAAVTAAVGVLPRRAMLVLGRGLGRVWGALDQRHLEIARDALRRAFPEWDEGRVDRTARGVYAHFGAVLLDILWLSRQSRERLLSIIDWEGRERVEQAYAAQRGILFLTAHIGNWEIHAIGHGWRHEPIGVVARPLDNPWLDARLCAFRRRSGNTVIYKRQALAQVLRTIRSGEGVAILLDQNVQAKDGIFVDFFGRPAATTTVAAAVARKTGCVVMVARTRLLANGRYRITYETPVEWTATDDRNADIAALTQTLTRRIEAWVRETPEQWLWIHRRWKTQPQDSQPSRDQQSDARSQADQNDDTAGVQ
jgi:Kdo2-lipid IVA lauroyltransferase/acyltransferase